MKSRVKFSLNHLSRSGCPHLQEDISVSLFHFARSQTPSLPFMLQRSAAVPQTSLFVVQGAYRSLPGARGQQGLRAVLMRGVLPCPDTDPLYHVAIHKFATHCSYSLFQAPARAFLAGFRELVYAGCCYSSIPPPQHCCWSYLFLPVQGNCQKLKFSLFLPQGRKNKGFGSCMVQELTPQHPGQIADQGG